MKNILLITIFLFSILFWVNICTAEGEGTMVVPVSVNLPWTNCTADNVETKSSNGQTWSITIYNCEVQKWSQWFFTALAFVINYFTFIVSLCGVLFIVYNWILYSMWWADDSLKTESKKRIVATLIGLVLFFLAWPILKLIAPWIYR
jgi:hypothetical protein